MTTEAKEIKANTASQAAEDRPTAELTDLPVAVEQTGEVSGGSGAARLSSQNNLKQMGIAVHN